MPYANPLRGFDIKVTPSTRYEESEMFRRFGWLYTMPFRGYQMSLLGQEADGETKKETKGEP